MEKTEIHGTELAAGEGGPTPERLIEVAERLFSEHGFAATSVRHITAAAGPMNRASGPASLKIAAVFPGSSLAQK
jgi:hypothetical protein